MKIVLLACIIWGATFVSVDASPLAYQLVALKVHNQYRKAHGVPMFTMNDEINHRARKCAEHYKKKGTIDHSCHHTGGSGENIFMGGCGRNETKKMMETAAGASSAFYSEVRCYDFFMAKPIMDANCVTGHFTQLIWRSSRILGFGFAHDMKKCKSYGVALYYPAGNYPNPDWMAANVPPAIRPIKSGTSNTHTPAGLLTTIGLITLRYIY